MNTNHCKAANVDPSNVQPIPAGLASVYSTQVAPVAICASSIVSALTTLETVLPLITANVAIIVL